MESVVSPRVLSAYYCQKSSVIGEEARERGHVALSNFKNKKSLEQKELK